MNFKEEIEKILNERKQIDPQNEVLIMQCWEKEIELVKSNFREVIAFIEHDCSDEYFYWFGEVFDDISDWAQSEEFFFAILERNKKVKDAEQRKSNAIDIEFAYYALPDEVKEKLNYDVKFFDTYEYGGEN